MTFERSASLPALPLQDYLFRLVPGFVESGKGKCSYDPKQENIAVLLGTRQPRRSGFFSVNCLKHSAQVCAYLSAADGNLYAGVHIDFMSTDAALFRTMGARGAIRTEQYDSRWLNGERASGGEAWGDPLGGRPPENPGSSRLCFGLQSPCSCRSSRFLTARRETTTNFTSSSVRRAWTRAAARAPAF